MKRSVRTRPYTRSTLSIAIAKGADLLLAGASCRALAASCVRAGLRPLACDLFADADLAATAPCLKLDAEGYPESVLAVLASLPPLPVVYTGALENHPELLDEIARRQPLLGNGGRAVRAARDPFRLARLFGRLGLATPPVRRPAAPPARGGWLSKPFAGSGGAGIRNASPHAEAPDRYFQKRVCGTPASALFATASRSSGQETICLGCTLQLAGSDWLAAPSEFAYCGNIAPLAIGERARREVERAGAAAARAFRLAGLFGLDFLLCGDTPHFLELNPRYTAAVETLEEACDFAALDLHLRACRGAPLPRPPDGALRASGKAVLYAERTIEFPRRAIADPEGRVRLADVPHPGDRIPAARPVLTLLASRPTAEECLQELRRAAERVRSLLAEAPALP